MTGSLVLIIRLASSIFISSASDFLPKLNLYLLPESRDEDNDISTLADYLYHKISFDKFPHQHSYAKVLYWSSERRSFQILEYLFCPSRYTHVCSSLLWLTRDSDIHQMKSQRSKISSKLLVRQQIYLSLLHCFYGAPKSLLVTLRA